jgi:hypothetical protein
VNAATSRELRAIAGPVLALVLLVAMFGLIGWSCMPQEGPSATADASEVVVLTAANPVAVRRFSWSVVLQPGVDPRGLLINLGVVPGGPDARGVELIAASGEPGDVGIHAGFPHALSGTEPCFGGCSATIDVVVHAPPEAFDDGNALEFQLVGHVYAELVSDADAEGSHANAVFTPSAIEATAPALASASLEGSVPLRGGEPGVRVRIRLRVDQEALGDRRGWPLVGRLHLTAVDADVDPDDLVAVEESAPGVRITVPNDEAWLDATGSIDWLGSCPPSGPCELPVDLDFSVAPGWNPETQGPPPTKNVEWSLVAELEAFDGTPLLPDAIVLELMDEGQPAG